MDEIKPLGNRNVRKLKYRECTENPFFNKFWPPQLLDFPTIESISYSKSNNTIIRIRVPDRNLRG